jgi:hypothetical protein
LTPLAINSQWTPIIPRKSSYGRRQAVSRLTVIKHREGKRTLTATVIISAVTGDERQGVGYERLPIEDKE